MPPRLLLLLFVAFAVATGSAEDEESELAEFDRLRRIPYYYPKSLQQKMYEEEEETNDKDIHKRSLSLKYHPTQKFHYWKQLVNGDNKRSDGDDKEMTRKRRIPYYYPKYNYRYSNYATKDDKRAKRVNPYFYPNMKYNFLGEAGNKRLFPWKRQAAKRNLAETLRVDDMSSFGYDKKNSPSLEELMEEEEEEEQIGNFQGEEDDKKKRALKKRTV